MTHQSGPGEHPDSSLLERFMRNEAAAAEQRWVVRHLIGGCSRCLAVTSRLWALADPPASFDPGVRVGDAQEPRSLSPAHGGLFERLADAGRRIEEEREQAPRLAAELLSSVPAAAVIPGTSVIPMIPATAESAELLEARKTPRVPETPAAPETAGTSAIIDLLMARPTCLTPAVCEVLLDRSREAAAGEPGLALRAADLALAIAECLDPSVCGPSVAQGLQVRAWAHVAQARRLADDLDGAEWALSLAESLAREMAGIAGTASATATAELADRPDPGVIETVAGTLPFVPGEWAELLVFKAGLFADRGDLEGADRLLGRAAELFLAGTEPQRAGRTLVQQGLIRADLGDRERAAELLRAGVDLLDPVAEPGVVAANLYRLAALLRGLAVSATEAKEGEEAMGRTLPAQRTLKEALRLVLRARTLYRALGDAVAEAHLTRLQGQIEAALGKLEDAEATLLAATAALAEQGFGREATLAQIELALVLVRQGRAAEVRRLGFDRWPLLQARDKSWVWVAAVLVFQVLAAGIAREPAQPAQPAQPVITKMLGELARYLAPRATHTLLQPHDPRHRRLERVA
jgi:tetratricopeptide (TPR) repeat protein